MNVVRYMVQHMKRNFRLRKTGKEEIEEMIVTQEDFPNLQHERMERRTVMFAVSSLRRLQKGVERGRRKDFLLFFPLLF